MLPKVTSIPYLLVCLGLSAMAVSSSAIAKCGCPDDGVGAQKVASGLGQAFPAAPDLAMDSAWQVYEFERDGVHYTQVNDQYGNVRAAVGRIGDTFWTIPMGIDADRVRVQGNIAPMGAPKVLFRSSEVEVVLYQDGSLQGWMVRSPSSL